MLFNIASAAFLSGCRNSPNFVSVRLRLPRAGDLNHVIGTFFAIVLSIPCTDWLAVAYTLVESHCKYKY